MGNCCSDEVDVPDEIIPDPTGEQMFYCKKNSMFGKDYSVFKDPECTQLWLLINGEGGFFDDNAYYQVENFVRPEGGKNGDGQVLAYCKLDKLSSDNYDYKLTDVDVDIEHNDSDDSDYSDDSDDEFEELEEFKVKQKAKFKCKTTVKFSRTPGAPVFAKLKVKAKGKASYKYKRTTLQDEETGEVHYEVEREEKCKVKKFFYKLEVDGVGEVPMVLDGSLNKGDLKMSWDSPFFEGKLAGGFTGDSVVAHTKGATESGTELLMAFMTMVMLSPDDIKSHASPPWIPPEWAAEGC